MFSSYFVVNRGKSSKRETDQRELMKKLAMRKSVPRPVPLSSPKSDDTDNTMSENLTPSGSINDVNKVNNTIIEAGSSEEDSNNSLTSDMTEREKQRKKRLSKQGAIGQPGTSGRNNMP